MSSTRYLSTDPPRLVGLGVDYMHAADLPLTLDGLLDYFAGRLTHLSIVALPDQAAGRSVRNRLSPDIPLVHHLSNVAPAEPNGPDWARLRAQEAISETIGALWCGEDIGAWSVGPYAIPYFIPPPLERSVARLIGTRIAEMSTMLARPFLAEIPSWAVVCGTMSLGAFFAELTSIGRCGLVLDVSHLLSYCWGAGRPLDEALSDMPMASVREIHVAGGRRDPRHPSRYIDSHTDRVHPDVLAALAHVVPSCPNLAGVTYEIAKGITLDTVQLDMENVERVLAAAGFTSSLTTDGVAPLREQGTTA